MAPGATWDAVRTEVRAFHAQQATRLLPTCKDFVFDEMSERLYFLGNDGSCPFTAGLSLHQTTSPRSLSPAPQPNPVGHEAINSGMASASGLPQSAPRAAGHGFGKCLTLFVAEVPEGTLLPSVAQQLPQLPLTPPISRTGSKRSRSWESVRASGTRSESRRRTQDVDGEEDEDMNGRSYRRLKVHSPDLTGFLCMCLVDVSDCTFVDLNPPFPDHNTHVSLDITPPPTVPADYLPTPEPSTTPPHPPETNGPLSIASSISQTWQPLVTIDWLRNHTPSIDLPSKEEQLMKERRRISTQGILSFQFVRGHSTNGNVAKILFSFGNSLYLGDILPVGRIYC